MRLGEDECRVISMPGKRCGVLLRATALEKWVKLEQRNWTNDRVSAVVSRGIEVVFVDQPVTGMIEE